MIVEALGVILCVVMMIALVVWLLTVIGREIRQALKQAQLNRYVAECHRIEEWPQYDPDAPTEGGQ